MLDSPQNHMIDDLLMDDYMIRSNRRFLTFIMHLQILCTIVLSYQMNSSRSLVFVMPEAGWGMEFLVPQS